MGIFEHGSLEKLTEKEPCRISPSSASANAVIPHVGVHSNAHLVFETLDAGGSEEEEVDADDDDDVMAARAALLASAADSGDVSRMSSSSSTSP